MKLNSKLLKYLKSVLTPERLFTIPNAFDVFYGNGDLIFTKLKTRKKQNNIVIFFIRQR